MPHPASAPPMPHQAGSYHHPFFGGTFEVASELSRLSGPVGPVTRTRQRASVGVRRSIILSCELHYRALVIVPRLFVCDCTYRYEQMAKSLLGNLGDRWKTSSRRKGFRSSEHSGFLGQQSTRLHPTPYDHTAPPIMVSWFTSLL